MPKKVAEFVKSLIVKAGGNLEDESIKTALAAFNSDLELPDELATAIDNGLLSISSAKNNHPDIKKHYFALAFNGLDAELDSFMDSEKVPDDVRAAIKAEQSSTKKAVLLSAKVKELERKSAAAGSKDKEEYARQIADLNNKLREMTEKEQGIHADYKKQLKERDKNYALRQIMGGYKTIYDDLDGETKSIILTALINKHLGAKNAELTTDDQGNLVLRDKDGNSVFGADHQVQTPKMFLDNVLATEKSLKVTDTGNNNSSNGSNGQHSQHNGRQNNGNTFNQNNNNAQNNNGSGKKNPVLASLVGESLAALEKSNGSGGF